MKDEVLELKKELEKVKKEGLLMENDETPLATEIIKILKGNVKRLYILLIILLVMFVVSVVDSFYQRQIIINLLEDMEVVEETVTEIIDVEQDGGDNSNNNFINGNNNEVNN